MHIYNTPHHTRTARVRLKLYKRVVEVMCGGGGGEKAGLGETVPFKSRILIICNYSYRTSTLHPSHSPAHSKKLLMLRRRSRRKRSRRGRVKKETALKVVDTIFQFLCALHTLSINSNSNNYPVSLSLNNSTKSTCDNSCSSFDCPRGNKSPIAHISGCKYIIEGKIILLHEKKTTKRKLDDDRTR